MQITRSKTRGPIFWQFLNIICWNYDESKKEEYSYLINHLDSFIPCEICKEHYQKNISQLDIDKALENNQTMSLFIVNLHNVVNRMNMERERKLDEHFENNILPLIKKESE